MLSKCALFTHFRKINTNKWDHPFPAHRFQFGVVGGRNWSPPLGAQGRSHSEPLQHSPHPHTLHSPSLDNEDTLHLTGTSLGCGREQRSWRKPTRRKERCKLHPDSGLTRNLFFFSHQHYKKSCRMKHYLRTCCISFGLRVCFELKFLILLTIVFELANAVLPKLILKKNCSM